MGVVPPTVMHTACAHDPHVYDTIILNDDELIVKNDGELEICFGCRDGCDQFIHNIAELLEEVFDCIPILDRDKDIHCIKCIKTRLLQHI